MNKDLPSVAGRLDISIAEFEKRCLVHIRDEQEKIMPDNALIDTLCNAVRLCREYVDTVKGT